MLSIHDYDIRQSTCGDPFLAKKMNSSLICSPSWFIGANLWNKIQIEDCSITFSNKKIEVCLQNCMTAVDQT